MKYDAVVIGGGAAGMAAASAIAGKGFRVLIIDREEYLGGILLQCIHTGFGIKRFDAELSGPEYAGRDLDLISSSDKIDKLTGTTVFDIRNNPDNSKTLYASSHEKGIVSINCFAVVLAMGCREKNRGNLGIPGARPSGVMTAGLAQRLLNIEGCVPGRRAVIIGSGDIGLIMARRLSWTGSEVLAVVEIMPYPSGLARNIAQCLEDFNIPLMLGHTVTNIMGHDRVEAVEIAPFTDGAADTSKTFRIDCDTVLLSVGLIPDNELSRKAGVVLSTATGGPYVDSDMMTNVPGIFACGNVLHVHDLVDNVSEESSRCGFCVAEYLSNGTRKPSIHEGRVLAGANLKYVSPCAYKLNAENKIYMRPLAPFESAALNISSGGKIISSRRMKHVKPSEMIYINIDKSVLGDFVNLENLPDVEISLTGV